MSVGNVIVNKTLAASSVSTASLASGKVLCSPFLFELGDAVLSESKAGKGELLQVQLTETASATPIKGDIRLHFFAPNDVAISPGLVGADFTMSAPEKWLGCVDIANGDYITAGVYAQATVFPKLHLFSGADNNKITVVAVTNGSIDYASGVALSLSLAVKQNI